MRSSETAIAIRSFRKFLGFTQEELARQIGVSLSTICRWEQGRSTPSRMAMASIERLTLNREENYGTGEHVGKED